MVEHPELDWTGRANYLTARSEIRQLENYAMDMLWVIARGTHIRENAPMPSEIWDKKPKDTRSAKQILTDMVKGLGGE